MNAKETKSWQCGECSVTYTLKVVANLCCMPKDCACGATISKTRWRCDTCKYRDGKFQWECAERKPMQKGGWLYSDGEYFQEPEDFIEGLDIEQEEFDELMALSSVEFARQYQVYLCKPYKPEPIDLNDHYQDFCFEDQPLPDGWEFCEEVIRNWIEDQNDWAWPQVETAIAWNGE
jgi:hypothetical protein